MILRRIAEPTAPAVTISDAKDFLRIQTSAEDYLLDAAIKTAAFAAENYMKRSIMRQQWELTVDDFPGSTGSIELPRAPLTTNSSDVVITYVEDTTAGDSTTLSSTGYTVDFKSRPGRVYPSYGNEWPDPRTQKNAVTITCLSGASAAVDVPEPIKTWIKLRVGAMYENRESISVGKNNWIDEFPHSFVDGLLDPFTIQTVYRP